MVVIVGTSGWQYASWRGRFYPRDLPQRAWLRHYAERFAGVEVNKTFYNLVSGPIRPPPPRGRPRLTAEPIVLTTTSTGADPAMACSRVRRPRHAAR